MTETPEERKQRLLGMIIDGPTWHHPVHRICWLLRKRRQRKGFVRLGVGKIGPIDLKVRQSDGTTKRVTWERDIRREYWPGDDNPVTYEGMWHRTGEPECDPLDEVQNHHDWSYEEHGEPLGICRRCGTLSQAWEE